MTLDTLHITFTLYAAPTGLQFFERASYRETNIRIDKQARTHTQMYLHFLPQTYHTIAYHTIPYRTVPYTNIIHIHMYVVFLWDRFPLQVLAGTDVLARGLDIKFSGLVVNFGAAKSKDDI